MIKRFSTMFAVGLMAVAMTSNAADYITKTASGSTAATVHFAAQPAKQIRIVGAVATSDKSGSVLSFTSGAGAYRISVSTNAPTTSITVSQTNGLETSDGLLVESSGNVTNTVIDSFNSTTNMTVTVAVGFNLTAGDTAYKEGSAIDLPVGNASQSYQGEAIYVGVTGRPVRVVLDGTSACAIDSITAVYD